MSDVGQNERAIQSRLVTLFTDPACPGWLGYRNLGNWQDEPRTGSVEVDVLRKFLGEQQGYSDLLIERALFELDRAVGDQASGLDEVNAGVSRLLRYGIKLRPGPGRSLKTVFFINWHSHEQNDFAIAQDVTIAGHRAGRLDLVLYVNGIALGALELNRRVDDGATGVGGDVLQQQEQNDAERFLTTQQLMIVGSDAQGVRYGTVETPPEGDLAWNEQEPQSSAAELETQQIENRLDRQLAQICGRDRILQVIDACKFTAG